MQDLHRNQPASLMHTGCDDAVVCDVIGGEKARRPRKHAALAVWGHAARHHQPDTAACAGRVEFGHAVPVAGFLKPRVHRSHQHAIFQLGKAQVQGRKQVGVFD